MGARPPRCRRRRRYAPYARSPLKGQGVPPTDVQEIFVSAYLDRLLQGRVLSPVVCLLGGCFGWRSGRVCALVPCASLVCTTSTRVRRGPPIKAHAECGAHPEPHHTNNFYGRPDMGAHQPGMPASAAAELCAILSDLFCHVTSHPQYPIPLAVDDRLYRHENIVYLFFSWRDPSAYNTTVQNYHDQLDGNCEWRGGSGSRVSRLAPAWRPPGACLVPLRPIGADPGPCLPCHPAADTCKKPCR